MDGKSEQTVIHYTAEKEPAVSYAEEKKLGRAWPLARFIKVKSDFLLFFQHPCWERFHLGFDLVFTSTVTAVNQAIEYTRELSWAIAGEEGGY